MMANPERSSDMQSKEFSALAYGFDAYFTKKEFGSIIKPYLKDVLGYKFIEDKNHPTIKVSFKNKGGMLRTCVKLHGSKHITKLGVNWILSMVNDSKLLKLSSRDVAQHSRIIVRNIPFRSDKMAITRYFNKQGPVHSVDILVAPGEDGKAVCKGCCFVQFFNPVDASRAILNLNKTLFLSRTIILDWAVPKSEYKSDVERTKFDKRDIANAKSIINEDQGDDIIKNITEKEHKTLKIRASVDTVSNDVKESPGIKRNIVDHERTIFITNIPIEVGRNDLKERLKELFGEIEYCEIVKDKVLKISNGSAFVKFLNPESAKEACHRSDQPGTTLFNNLDVNISGSVMTIRPALSRDELQDLKNSRELLRSKKPTEDDLKEIKRRKSFSNREIEKTSDKNLFVSDKRVCLRNLPVTMDESMIRQYITEKLKIPMTKIKVIVVRDKHRKEPVAIRKAKKVKNRSLGYAFIQCSNTKLAKSIIELLDGKSVNNIINDEKLENKMIAQYSIENRDKINCS